jgi:hypothetical protein
MTKPLGAAMLPRSFLPALIAAIVINAAPAFAQSDVVRIDEPQVDGLLLDWCRSFSNKCGQPAADAFCRASGHRRSVRFQQWVSPRKPTRTIDGGGVCDDPGCDSFKWIECRK